MRAHAKRNRMWDRHRTSLALAIALLAAPLAATAQEHKTGRIPRIALMSNVPEADMAGPIPRGRGVRAFVEGLRDLGWVDGQNIQIERRSTEGRPDRRQALLQEIARLPVDALVTVGVANVMAAKQATTTIPIVMAGASLPVESGLIKSLARPGGNITGMTFEASGDLDGKRLELLKEVAPKVSRVAVIGAGTVSRRSNWKAETEAAAHALGLTLRLLAVDAPEEFGKAFAAITRERPHALFVANSPANASRRGLIIDFAARQKLPAVYSDRDFVELGGLMAYGPDFADLYRRAALYVDKILKGANPGDLPIEQPTKFELVVNLRTARALGLTIPASVLLRADETIE